ncbi:MAG: LPS export ABC transporter periplasmic protein LptC [Mailhella sp.]|nr:LPS export ABC transporter periplasmic protein LptC [Mailhella sp.]
MNDFLRRNLILIIVALVAWGGWYGWESWRTRQALNALEDVVRSTDLNELLSNPPAEVQKTVDLAIRGISLSQGKDGRKSFELKADWATLHQKSGTITVREPDILYSLKDGSDGPRTVHATSNIGRVEDGNQKISMSDEVRAQHEQNVLSGDLAIFFSEADKLTFPGGAELNGPDLSGSCAQLTWDLNTNILLGDHGVSMRWYPSGRKDKGSQAEDTASTVPVLERSATSQEADKS